ncbi:hypothetical protein GCM10011574_22540 [Microbispora bryophytorum]|uniref:Uncharacterized protein n=1 Tax=Microbispora bryophytorum TaxID=1460882 RepID=A0A8H9GZF8_9ACTN|nr:hypothetical protein GCM10011574_22540 [Microbispora bryophytorum]
MTCCGAVMIPKVGWRECGIGSVLSAPAAPEWGAPPSFIWEGYAGATRMAWSPARRSGMMSKRDRVPF